MIEIYLNDKIQIKVEFREEVSTPAKCPLTSKLSVALPTILPSSLPHRMDIGLLYPSLCSSFAPVFQVVCTPHRYQAQVE